MKSNNITLLGKVKIKDSIILGQVIRAKRKTQKLTQRELAGASGTGLRFIIDLEKGKSTCQFGKILLVLQMLGITLSTHSGNKL